MNGRFRIPGLKSGALHTWVLVFVLVGMVATCARPADVATEHRQECHGIVRDSSTTDPQAWDLLIEQGYRTRVGDPDRLYPPGCEAAP